jgi:TolB-like protein/Flp pilus assembly protein TadD
VSEGRLDSWKEIATHLGRSVRTVQRWEQQEGLPVHRLQHEKLGSVYAFASELDAWWEERRVGLEPPERPAADSDQDEGGGDAPATGRRWLGAGLLAAVLALAGTAWVGRPAAQPANPPRIAVLPFTNLTGSPDREFISDGLTEELIADLGHVRGLGVIARTSVMSFKGTKKTVPEITRELQVDYLLEGSVREAGARLRVTAQLIRADDQTHLWVESYDREIQDLLSVQEEVALRVAREVQALVPPPRRPGVNAEAYLAYLRGRHSWNERTETGFRQALVEFERAIALDPGFAPAWSGLADTHALMSNYGQAVPREAMPKARDAALKAVALEDGSAEGHASLALVLACFDWDFAAAEREFRRALDLNPNYSTAWLWYGQFLARLGRHHEAQAKLEQALKADPLSRVLRASLDHQDFNQRRFAASLRVAEAGAAREPDSPYSPLDLARAQAALGSFPEATASMERACALRPGDPMLEAYLAYAQARAGDHRRAEDTLRRLEAEAGTRHVPPYYLALVAAGLDDRPRALAFLERAYAERHVGVLSVSGDPEFDGLRGDAGFQDLLRRAGIR